MRLWGILAAVMASLSAAAVAAEPLRSPWDLHPVKAGAAPYQCPAEVHLPRDITAYSYYSDSKHSIADPERYEEYRATAEPYERLAKAVEQAADTYRKNGSPQAAACVVHLLAVAAKDQAMTGRMASNQSYYLQNWTAGELAITYLKVRPAAAGVADRETIGWLVRLAHSVQDYFDERRKKKTNDGQNNHAYWAGLAVMAVGVAANDRRLYDWGVKAYRAGIGQIDGEGGLPLEMARGTKALHYHLFAAQPLVLMAELGEANGQELYGEKGKALPRLVERALSGLLDNSYFAQQAGIKQDTPGVKLKTADLAWARPYLRRFPNEKYAALLQELPSLSDVKMGGEPPE